MDIHITVKGQSDLAGQVYRQLREGILDGRLAAGDRLPSTRLLAIQIGVSRKTTLDAFEKLISEGYLLSQAGNGTFVANKISRISSKITSENESKSISNPIWNEIPQALAMPRPENIQPLDFRGGVTDKELLTRQLNIEVN
jgi:GntR family transcriptional regulator/MocR family aminotransferase